MPKYNEPYLYRLVIHNLSGRDLILADVSRNHGIWFRGGIDGEAPVAIPAKAEVEALGIRAAANPVKGYEFRCVWESGDDDNAHRAGSLALFVSVPFWSGKNRAGLDVSGSLRVEGWTGVSILGHSFSHRLIVQPARQI